GQASLVTYRTFNGNDPCVLGDLGPIYYMVGCQRTDGSHKKIGQHALARDVANAPSEKGNIGAREQKGSA
ncbi:MAG: hypothetical protein AAB403_06080, partial [Planctomycetota bacterium]